MGALLVGLNFAKAFAYSRGIPFIGVNHMEAHIYANLIDDPRPSFPFVCLIVSGGHTQLVHVEEGFRHSLLGETLDDAAGEAFDKVAKMLGLGFPGGPIIDRLASAGNPEYVRFPRSFLDRDSFDFSFSGIKTAVMYWLRDHPAPGGRAEQEVKNLCASFQAAVVDVLIEKTASAAAHHRLNDVAIGGGVSANSELRRRMKAEAGRRGFRLFMPRMEYCTDNAAMVALAGAALLASGKRSSLELQAVPGLSI
jgi:N6-L-threonylcarbamoyladenine synthase